MSFLSEVVKIAGKKIVEEVVIGVAAGAAINAAKDHGPDFVKAVAKKTPAAFEAAKDKASDAVDTAKVVGQAAKKKFGPKS